MYRDSVRDPTNSLFGSDAPSSVWLVDIDNSNMYPLGDADAIPDNVELGIVIESLQQPHTTVTLIS